MESIQVKVLKDFIGKRFNKKDSIVSIQEEDYILYKKMGFIDDVNDANFIVKDNKEDDIKKEIKHKRKAKKWVVMMIC